MATVKIGTLLIRTLAKPISTRIKSQAREHERFRKMCVSLAQTMYRYEARLRTGLLGEPAKHIRPLSEAKAIENGANFLAEGFLFSVATALIIGETWRSSRNQSKQRSDVNGSIEELRIQMRELVERLQAREEDAAEERRQYQELARILGRTVEIGLRGHGGNWAEAQEGSDLQIPRVQPNVLQPTLPSGPYASTGHTEPSFRSANTVLNPNDIQNIS